MKKQNENNEKIMKNIAKTMKNDEKVWLEDFDPTTAGSRISTQQLARGLRPIHPGYYNGKHNGKTKNGKNEKVISIIFKVVKLL